MFGKDDTTEKYEKAKEAYESYINILDRVIEKQLELAEALTGDNANTAYQKAIDTIKEQSSNARVLGRQYLDSGPESRTLKVIMKLKTCHGRVGTKRHKRLE